MKWRPDCRRKKPLNANFRLTGFFRLSRLSLLCHLSFMGNAGLLVDAHRPIWFRSIFFIAFYGIGSHPFLLSLPLNLLRCVHCDDDFWTLSINFGIIFFAHAFVHLLKLFFVYLYYLSIGLFIRDWHFFRLSPPLLFVHLCALPFLSNFGSTS